MATILLADADLTSRESIKLVLNGSYQVFDASKASDIWDVLDNNAIDLVLIDTDLSGENSTSCIHELKNRYPDQTFVLLCLARECDAIRAAIEFEALDYVLKPFDIDRLRFVLNRAFQFVELSQNNATQVISPDIQQEEANNDLTLSAIENLIGQVSLKQATNDIERKLIAQALEKTNNVQTQAAELLGTTRRILRYKMEQHGLD